MLAFNLLNDVRGVSDVASVQTLTSETKQLPQWAARASNACMQFIQFLVMPDPRMRLSVAQALEHPWFRFSS